MHFKEWILAERKQGTSQPVVMFHGTHINNLKSILSQGLIPDYKTRSWDEDPDTRFDIPSRKSLEGIYLTDNLLTAMSSAGRGNHMGAKAIIVVQVVPRSLMADEDDMGFASIVGMPNSMNIEEHWATILYKKWKMGDPLEEYKNHYISNAYDAILYKLKKIHPKLSERIKYLLGQGFYLALTRMAAHVYDDTWRFTGEGDVDKPQIGKAENDFLKYKDSLTRTLKTMAMQHSFNPTSRLLEPIGFSGKNKILAILELDGPMAKEGIVQHYPRGNMPKEALSKIKSEWASKIGKWPGVNQPV